MFSAKQRPWFRSLSVFLVLVLVFQLLPATIHAAKNLSAAEEQTAEPLTVMGEVAELRTETEKHYRLSNGSYVAVDYGMPIHLENSDGFWVDIDNTLSAATKLGAEGVSSYITTNEDETKIFAATFTPDAPLFSAQTGDYGVSMSLLQPGTATQLLTGTSVQNLTATTQQFTSAQAAIMNATNTPSTISLQDGETAAIEDQVQLSKLSSTVVYSNILPGVDLQYDIVGRDIKESIIVNQTQSSYVYSFRLELEGLVPVAQEDGSILLNNAAGDGVYKIPAPYMIDAAGQVSQSVSYSLSPVSDGFVLTVTADTSWINADERTLPVTIDPALVVVTGRLQENIYATYVDEIYPGDSRYGSHMYMGQNAGYGYHGYLYFSELPAIPANCSVTGATISLYQMWYDHIGITQFYGQIQPVNSDIAALAGGQSYDDYLADLTWNDANGVNGVGGLVLGAVEDYATISTSTKYSYITWNISRSVADWYTTQNAAERFMAITPWYDSDITSSNYAATAFYTFTDTPSYKPLFVVYYRNDVGIESRFTYQSVAAARAGGGVIGDYTSQMTWGNTLMVDASSTLPFSLALYHNTANKDVEFVHNSDAGIHTTDYTTMRTGLGWKLSIQESITEITVETEDASITYYAYQDADGTEHYFNKTSAGPYKDDEGMGLTLTVSGSTYILEDKGNNKKTFYNGYLISLTDANGNALYYCYNGNDYSSAGTSWKPTSSGSNRVTSVFRVNNVGSKTPELVCCLAYSGNYLSTVTDAAGRTTTLGYGSTATTGRQLTSVTFPDGVKAQYAYAANHGLYRAYDTESQYGLEFDYRNFMGRLCVEKVREYSATAIAGTQTIGNAWHCWVFSKNQKEYRFYGNDQTSGTPDDIVTRYTFDYLGRTVNVVNLNNNKTEILGIAANAYTLNNGTSAKNNRLTGAASMGMAAVNLLNNSSFERSTNLSGDTSRYAWTAAKSGSGTTVYVVPPGIHEPARTGDHCLELTHPASLVSDTSVPASYASADQRVYLKAGTAYTFSGYVDTSGITSFGKDGGAYLRFMTSSGMELAASRRADYVTNNDIADGWTRLEVSCIPSTTAWYRVGVVLKNAAGSVYADDFQLEAQAVWSADEDEQQCVGASSYNLLQIGSFELWNSTTADRDQDPVYWTYDATKASPGTDGAYGDKGYSMYIRGNLTAKRRASQTVPLGCPGTTTFILSGWGKATAMMDDDANTTITGDNDTGERFFGLIAKLTYSDNSTEYHHVHFDTLYTDWQYASGFIVPKTPAKGITSITVSTAYDYNANYARFDNILLTQEPAQTYTYDEEGNLQTVIDAATGEESYTYEGANLTEYVSSGSGTYQYDYDENNNLTKAWNDGVGTKTTYDSAGNATSTRLSQVNESGDMTAGSLYLYSTAAYTSDGNYVESVTDANGGKVSYTYSPVGHLLTTTVDKESGDLVTTQTYLANSDRLSESTMENWAAVKNTYTRGMLAEVTRKAYLTGGTAADIIWQKYVMTYDKWGNVTEIKVRGSSSTSNSTPTSWYSGVTLGKYTYSGENGVLEKMEYGNGTYITYEYDVYGRQTWVKHWDSSDALTSQEHYFYNGNGNVSRIEHLDGTGNLLDAYTYEYDSLGRLIRSQMEDADEVAMQTEHIYDASNRLSSQNYVIGGVDFSEEFVYNEADGTLSRMTVANGDTLTYQYDELKRLESVTAKDGSTTLYTKGYVYALYGTNDWRTTGRISQVNYDIGAGIDFDYTYDELGNIATYNGITYGYDDLGQLTSVTKDGMTTTFVYDTAGNIREVRQNGTVVDTYAYGNNNWKDLLTAFNNQPIIYEGQTLNNGVISGTPVSGNPTSYFNGTRWNFTWQNGRQLASASTTRGDTDIDIAYTYDLNGLRTSKTVTYTTTEESGDQEHTHSYTSTVTAPTCLNAGYTTYACACGDSYTDNIVSALGHNYVESETETGSVFTCSRCGDSYTGHQHTYTESVVAPSCIMRGYTIYTCSCGDTYMGNYVPALGHDGVEIGRTDTMITYLCNRCGATYQQPIIVDPNPPVEMRLRRSTVSVTTEYHEYIYASGQLLQETITTTDAEGNVSTQTLDFAYDGSGYPYALTYTNGSASPITYYYIVNLQGDVEYLVTADGTVAAEYAYDAWGQIVVATGAMAEVNPLRYRGYCYDAETEFYYLQSRYYDPVICRFVNADGYASTGRGFLGQNMFAYCRNSPVIHVDFYGREDVLVIYDSRQSGWPFGLFGGKGFEKQGQDIVDDLEAQGHNVTVITFETMDEFVEKWNEIEGEYDTLYIVGHGDVGSLDCAGKRLMQSNGDYSPDDLNEIVIRGNTYLFSCEGGTYADGKVPAAQFIADLTNSNVYAVDDGGLSISYMTTKLEIKSKNGIKGKWVCFVPSFTSRFSTRCRGLIDSTY